MRLALRRIATVASACVALAAGAADYVAIPTGSVASVLANDADPLPRVVAGFAMRSTPVMNGEFLAFVTAHLEWQRGRVAATFADKSYLVQWSDALSPGPADTLSQPVTNVSWFAAEAYCEGEGARLPTWLEWEYVAAADETHFDARQDPSWRAQILEWYSRPASETLRAIGGSANAYGVRDLHGLVWEWVDDFNALLVSGDSRNQGDPDKAQFCGAGAIAFKDRDSYAVLMRIALLSSLEAADTTSSLGFRCVRP